MSSKRLDGTSGEKEDLEKKKGIVSSPTQREQHAGGEVRAMSQQVDE